MIIPFIYELKQSLSLHDGFRQSAIGKVVSSIIDVPFVDADFDLVPSVDTRDFRASWRKFFRDKEYQVIKRLLKESPVFCDYMELWQ